MFNRIYLVNGYRRKSGMGPGMTKPKDCSVYPIIFKRIYGKSYFLDIQS